MLTLFFSRNAKNLQKLTERELEMGIDTKNSWHNMYKDSAWVFIGGLHYDLSEGMKGIRSWSCLLLI